MTSAFKLLCALGVDRHIRGTGTLANGVVALDSETFQSTQGSLDEHDTGPFLCKCVLIKLVSV